MIRYVIRESRTAKWLTTFNRSYATTKSITHGQGNGYSNSNASAPNRASDGTKHGLLKTSVGVLKDRQHGVKAYKPRDLPISPFMDPEVIAARHKHKLPKLPPSKNPSLFQQQLAKNAYAQALASPVRQCQVTETRLPSYFLQDFQLMAHPETREPWWVPTSLRNKNRNRERVAEAVEIELTISDEDSGIQAQAEGLVDAVRAPKKSWSEPESPSPALKTLPTRTPSLGPSVYTLSRHALLMAMKNPKSGWSTPPGPYFRPGSIQNSAIGRKVYEHASWRTDMEEFVLELMRRRVVEGLVYLVNSKRGYVAGCIDWGDAMMPKRQQGAILWTGKQCHDGEEVSNVERTKGREEEQDDRLMEHYPGRHEPPAFATLTIGEDQPHMVAVHNLPVLLGADYLLELRTKAPIFNKEVLILRHKRLTVEIQMRLWKLQGYLAFPEVSDEIPKRKSVEEDARLNFTMTHSRS